MPGPDRSRPYPRDVTNRAIAHARLRSSRLVGDAGVAPLTDPLAVVRWFGAVQSQDVTGAFWALGQRLPAGTTVRDVGAAFDRGEIVRTHALRPTWHFLAPDELRWIEVLTGPRVRRANDNVGRRRLGIDRNTFERANGVIEKALAGGAALTRDELRRPLLEAGIPLDAPNSLAHVVMNAELDGLICSGPRRGTQFTYQLVDDRIPPSSPLPPDVALRDLTVRYFTSHGPALVHDMAWWSGLTVTDVRRGIELAGGELEARTIDGKGYVAAAAAGFEPANVPEPHVLLLSNYDEYLGSYTDYAPIFDDSLPKERTIADVLGVHIVVRDGLVVGGWRRSLTRDRAIASVTLLRPLSPSERVALEAEAERWARFLGLACELRVTTA
jgi:Winged helix DNA-binding domain